MSTPRQACYLNRFDVSVMKIVVENKYELGWELNNNEMKNCNLFFIILFVTLQKHIHSSYYRMIRVKK